MKSPMVCSIAMVVALVGFSPVARALDQVPILSLDLARKMAAGCEAKAKEMIPLAAFRNWPTARISKEVWYQDLRWFPESLRSLVDCRL
jgi:hypothetical protein